MKVYLVETSGYFEMADGNLDEYENCLTGIYSTLEKAQNAVMSQFKKELAEHGIIANESSLYLDENDEDYYCYNYTVPYDLEADTCGQWYATITILPVE